MPACQGVTVSEHASQRRTSDRLANPAASSRNTFCPPFAPLRPAPQLYISGEFVGGADIAEQMVGTGELQTLVRSAAAKDPN